MRVAFYVITAAIVLTLAVWAYRENYRTQRTLAHIAGLQTRIADMREHLEVLEADWAYLNRPARLRALAAINYDPLALMPMEPDQFGTIGEIAFPPAPQAGESGDTGDAR